jgi:glycosyltransferase involved in cell wall biosynthesis
MAKLSVIIPTLNEENYVGALIFDRAEQTKAADEIIFVDGRSKGIVKERHSRGYRGS